MKAPGRLQEGFRKVSGRFRKAPGKLEILHVTHTQARAC
jgi:hypothetical protein